jgi:hypothetical protein
MESLLETLGLLFFMFLVLAAAVEVILEIFRGVLEKFGVTWSKGKVSLEDALKLAREFAPDSKDLHAKLESVRAAAKQVAGKAKAQIESLDAIRDELAAAGARTDVIAGKLNAVAGEVNAELQKSERARIFALRFIAALVGCALAWWSDFHVFQILANDPKASQWIGELQGLQSPALNVLVGGMAAAAGSSYWHDKLDKVRSLKAAVAEAKKLGS